MGLLIANDNLLTALGITNKEQFDQTFADFSEFETFVEKCGYEYDFDEEGNLILITPKSKEINTGIVVKKDYSKEYFTLEAIENGTIYIQTNNYLTFSSNELYYSIDNGENWISVPKLNSDQQYTLYNVLPGDKIIFKGNSSNIFYKSNDKYYDISSTGKYKVYGNMLSLISDNENFSPDLTNIDEYSFFQFFKNDTNILDASNLILPPEKYYAVSFMFHGCTSLTTPPELPATTLTRWGSYASMFQGCTSLTTAPKLPATTLASNCYTMMFQNCTNLTTAPELPATTLATQCYQYMFYNCTNLISAPELPATDLIKECYMNMFYNCTSLTKAPELPATTLTEGCYESMFQGCNNLNYIKAMFTTLSSIDYTWKWVSGVSSTGTFVKNSAATWNETGPNGVPTGWTVETADS